MDCVGASEGAEHVSERVLGDDKTPLRIQLSGNMHA